VLSLSAYFTIALFLPLSLCSFATALFLPLSLSLSLSAYFTIPLFLPPPLSLGSFSSKRSHTHKITKAFPHTPINYVFNTATFQMWLDLVQEDFFSVIELWISKFECIRSQVGPFIHEKNVFFSLFISRRCVAFDIKSRHCHTFSSERKKKKTHFLMIWIFLLDYI